MLEQRSLKVDLLALGLLALTVFLAASLLSYDAADPPNALVYPQRPAPMNVCGRSGAVVSWVLFGALGLGAYYLLLSLAVLDAMLLSRRTIGEPLLRTAGWLVSLVGLTTLAAMVVPGWSPGPVIGSGGYLGAAGRGLLQSHFANVGAYILAVSLILGGLLLSTEYVVLRILAWTVGAPARGLGRGVVRVGAAYAGRLGAGRGAAAGPGGEFDAMDEDGGDEPGDSPTVRIAGRGEDDADGNADAKAVADLGEEDSSEESPEPTRKQDSSALRIKKPKKTKRQELIDEIDAEGPADDAAEYELPDLDLLLASEPFFFEEHEKEVRRRAKILEKTFANFGFNIRVVEIQTGPVVAQYEVELEAGLRLSKITGLADDLAIALRVPSVRIVAPIPGKNTVGIEVPNTERQLVRLREVMEETNGRAQKMRIPIFLGKDVAGNPMIVDLTTLPHLLIAGRTGTGKSVCLNSIIVSMLMTRRPDEVKMLMIDPKMVELSPYKRLPHLMHPVVTDMRKAEAILAWAVEKMEERYHLLAQAGVRHISVYNQLGMEELIERIQPAGEEEEAHIPSHLPYIVIVADEMADLMMTAAKEVEGHIIRLAQKSRAVGIHLVLATQKPTVDVITGLIKSNLPARIAFQVASRTDSRVVLDEMGADKLLGNGDMLFLWPGTSCLIRGQGTYLCDDEINRVIDAVATSEPQFVKELVQLKAAEPEEPGRPLKSRDELYEAAIDIVVREGRGSVSLLQRTLGIGYGRAARLIDFMAEDGIVGAYNGSQAREILIGVEEWEAMNGHGTAPDDAPERESAAPRQRGNKIFLNPSEGNEEVKPPRPVRSAVPRHPADVEDEDEDQEENAPWEGEDDEEEEQDEDGEEYDEFDEGDEENGGDDDDEEHPVDEQEYEEFNDEEEGHDKRGPGPWAAESA
jgi:S-DNA-T family DNA segregation ATPase FtsK/SpoIIIE